MDSLATFQDITADKLKVINILHFKKFKKKETHFYFNFQIKKIHKKATSVVECLKQMKKGNNSEYSQKAGDILQNWKTIVKQQQQQIEYSDYNQKNNLKKDLKDVCNNVAVVVPLPTLSLDNIIDVNELKSTHSTSTSHSLSTNNFKSTLNLNLNNQNSINGMRRGPATTSTSTTSFTYLNDNYNENLTRPATTTTIKNRLLSDDEALSKILKSKHSARMLYTGRKHVDTHVPKLFELCSRVLVENLDDLPCRINYYSKYIIDLFRNSYIIQNILSLIIA